MKTILGREPALWIGLIGALLAWAGGVGLDWLNAGQATAAITAITAVIIALTTRPIAPALYVAAVSAAAALIAEYGLHLSDESVASLGAIILAGFALFGIRPQVTPKTDQAPIAPANGSVR